MNSSGHRAAIMRDDNGYMGVGVCKKENGGWFYVQDFSDNPDAKITVAINANGGTFPTLNNVTTYTLAYPNNTYGIIFPKDIPTPVRDGYTFSGWLDKWGDNFEGMYATNNQTLTASWTLNE